MAVELGREWYVRHGHLRFARLFRLQRRSSNAQSGCSCAEAGATTTQTTAKSRFVWRELRRQEASFDDEGGGRLGVDGRGRRVELSLNENFCFSDQHRKLRGAFCFLGRGRRGTDWN